MRPVLFTIPGVNWPLHTYGMLIVTGFLIALYVAWREAFRQKELYEEVLDFAFWGLVGGLIGARIVFIIVNWQTYMADPVQIFVFWKGGLVFYGAFLGGFTAFVLFARSRRMSLVQSLKLGDLLASVLPLAQVFGRFGCMAAGCCWGRAAYHIDQAGKVIQDIPFAARFPAAHDGQPAALAYSSLIRTVDPSVRHLMTEMGTTMPLIPSQLLESIGAGIIFTILILMRSRKWFHGQILLMYAAMYAIMRFFLEFMRGDAERGLGGGFSTSQWISLGVATACIIAVFTLRSRLANAKVTPAPQ